MSVKGGVRSKVYEDKLKTTGVYKLLGFCQIQTILIDYSTPHQKKL